MKNPENMHRYNLVLSKQVFGKLQEVATEQSTTVAELIRKCIRIGLMILEAQAQGKDVLIREGKDEQRITFV